MHWKFLDRSTQVWLELNPVSVVLEDDDIGGLSDTTRNAHWKRVFFRPIQSGRPMVIDLRKEVYWACIQHFEVFCDHVDLYKLETHANCFLFVLNVIGLLLTQHGVILNPLSLGPPGSPLTLWGEILQTLCAFFPGSFMWYCSIKPCMATIEC